MRNNIYYVKLDVDENELPIAQMWFLTRPFPLFQHFIAEIAIVIILEYFCE
jgi:hypothetical protein